MSNPLITAVTRACLHVLGWFSPGAKRRGQRILFLSGLSNACITAGILEKDTLTTLNQSLSIAKDSDALNIGANISKELWPTGSISTLLCNVGDTSCEGTKYPTLTEAERTRDKLLEITPKWLCYGDDQMKTDVLDFLCDNPVGDL